MSSKKKKYRTEKWKKGEENANSFDDNGCQLKEKCSCETFALAGDQKAK